MLSTYILHYSICLVLPFLVSRDYYAAFARNSKAIVKKLHDYPVEQVYSRMAEGKAKSSFLSTQLETLDRDGPDALNKLDDIKAAAGGTYATGVDTTWSTLSMFSLAMVLHPKYQVRAQKEIDLVVDSGRLPGFGDRPYVECILQETLRWNSATPLGVPHLSVENDVYSGVLIPRDSVTIANTTAMTLDETDYNDPFTFDSACFLPKPEGNTNYRYQRYPRS